MPDPKEIALPFNFTPRNYQEKAMVALDSGIDRIITIWPRRSGKDKTWFNMVVKKMFERVGNYFYMFPTYNQGKKILWNGIDRSGFKTLDHIPLSVRKRTDNSEMLIELVNGSTFQVIGTDNIDSVVGTNPVGCVFSEYPLQDPAAWGYIRPILAENKGWAVFDYTPRGKMNHGYDLYQMAKKSPHWYTSLLTVDDIQHIDKETLAQEREEIIAQYGDDSLFLQEYYCSFEAAIQGAYYIQQFKKAEQEKRITTIPHEGSIKVDTWWDLGVGDATAIWFTQNVGQQIRVIDYYQATGEGLPHYAQVLQNRGYIYNTHNAPHDIQVRELGSGVSRLETARKLGINFQVVKNISIDDGINAVRLIFQKCWFDEVKCKQGLNALANYHKKYDEQRKEYSLKPDHDWSSHGSDAFRYFAVGHKNSPVLVTNEQLLNRKRDRKNSYSLKMV